jgi:hypothetical protein
MLHWGHGNAVRVDSVAVLEGVLTLVGTLRGQGGVPYAVDLLPAGVGDGGLRIGVGHPARAFILALDAPAAYGVQPDVDPWPEPIRFDHGCEVVEIKPAQTRVLPCLARRAAREYLLTGDRPACLPFDPHA